MDPLTRRPRIATVWLGGCSGCHMSFLDMDERLLDLLAVADLVYSPIMDVKEFPPDVDVTLVEGAVANEDHVGQLALVRAHTRVLVALGDCAVTGNVTALRNPLGAAEPVLARVYLDPALRHPQLPHEPGIVPPLLDRVDPLHVRAAVDVWVPGCPPSADLIHHVLTELVAGRMPDLHAHLKYG